MTMRAAPARALGTPLRTRHATVPHSLAHEVTRAGMRWTALAMALLAFVIGRETVELYRTAARAEAPLAPCRDVKSRATLGTDVRSRLDIPRPMWQTDVPTVSR